MNCSPSRSAWSAPPGHLPRRLRLDAASVVVAGAEIAASDSIEYITSLVSKSLVGADISGGGKRFRLLETTRAYALEKLAERGEFEFAARRHAEFCRQLFERAEAEWEARPTAEWLADYGWQIADVRAALDWAFPTAAIWKGVWRSPSPRCLCGYSSH
jgi:predicted ATPase